MACRQTSSPKGNAMRFRTIRCLFFVAVGQAILAAAPGSAEEAEIARTVDPSSSQSNDALFAPAGHLAGTVASGIPYVGIVELAYGVTSGFTVGVIAGVTPDTEGIGLRLRGVVAKKGNDRIVLTSPILYYPGTASSGGDQWLLVMPSLLAEHRFEGGLAVHVGLGFAAAECTDSIGSFFRTGSFGREKDDDQKMGFMGDVWATATVGAGLPVGRATALFGDVTLVTQGLALGHHWVGIVPVIGEFGIKQTF